MNRSILQSLGFVLLLAFSAVKVNAAEPLKLKWTELSPRTEPMKHPLRVLSFDQRAEFDNIEYWLSLDMVDMSREAATERREAKSAAKKSRRKLQKQGFDVDDLYKRYGDWQGERDRRSRITVKKYDGKLVSLAGYLLPLDFSENGVKEFLLVPYVGACIHVPPPPANQMAFIRMNSPYKIKGLYDPVWVTGRMSTKQVRKKLTLVDGSDMLDIGYTLHGNKISKYVKPKLPPLPQ